MSGRSFWDLNEALKCVQGGDSHINKLRKPETVRALTALTWFVRTLPDALALLQEVRALAGRVVDGLDRPGEDEYVDHARMALLAQSGLSPYAYTRTLMKSGIPYAGPPRPGHVAAHSYVPEVGGAGAGAGGTHRGAAASMEEDDDDGDEESLLFSGLGTLNGGRDGDKVSATVVNDDLDRVGNVDDPERVPPRGSDHGNVRAPAATDPLVVAAGVTVGRIADQSQDQARTRAPDTAGSAKKQKLCKSVWKDDVCRDRDCERAHPPRCGDPRCFPQRREDCQHWHRLGVALRQQQQQQQQSSQPSQQRQQRGQQQRQRQSQQQGNGRGAGPGRAGQRQAQGMRRGARQQGQGVRRQQQQPNGGRQQQQQRQQQQPNGGRRQQQQRQQQQQQQQQQNRRTYRDVAACGTLHSSPSLIGLNGHVGGGGETRGPLDGVGFAPVQPNQAMLSTVVAAVLAVLSGRGQQQHF